MAGTILERKSPTKIAPRPRQAQTEFIARDLALMDELEAYVQSLPDRRAEAGLGPLPDEAVAFVYEEREAALL